MKLILVGGRYINTERIDAVLLPDSQSASVWYGGNPEPIHARAGELFDLRQYVMEAQYGGSRA